MSLTYFDDSNNDPGNALPDPSDPYWDEQVTKAHAARRSQVMAPRVAPPVSLSQTQTPEPQAEQGGGWMDGLKKTISGLLPKAPEPQKQGSLYDRYAPVLKAAGIEDADPQHALLRAISDHMGAAPIPQETSGSQKAWGIGLNAIGAGLLRSAGASPEGSQAATRGMIEDWQNRRNMADSARMDAWKTGGSVMIPQVQNAVQSAENKKILQQQAAANRGRIFGEETPPPANAPPGGTGGPPARAATPTAATLPPAAGGAPAGTQGLINGLTNVVNEPGPAMAQGMWQTLLKDHKDIIEPILKGANLNPADPNASKQAAQVVLKALQGGGQPPPPQAMGRSAEALSPKNMPMAEPDRPTFQLGRGPHYFYTEQWRNAADSILRGNIDNNALIGMGIKVDPTKSKEAQAEDALMQLKTKDEAAHYASPGYKAHVKSAETYAEKNVQAGMDMKAKLDTGAEAGRNANRTLDLMRSAFEETQKSGVLGPGFATAWLTNINNALDRAGLPHMQTAPIQMINELSNRMGIESMMEEMSAGNGMKGGGQRMFMAFREAVANTSQNPAGFAAIMEAMQALNNTQVAGQDAANEWMREMEKRGRVPVLDHNAQEYINSEKQKAFQQAQVAVNKVLQQGASASPKTAGGAAAPPLSKDETRAAVTDLITKSGGKLSVPEAMDLLEKQRASQQGGSGTPPAAAATPAPAAKPADGRPSNEAPLTRRLYDWMYGAAPQKKVDLGPLRKIRDDLQQGPT